MYWSRLWNKFGRVLFTVAMVQLSMTSAVAQSHNVAVELKFSKKSKEAFLKSWTQPQFDDFVSSVNQSIVDQLIEDYKPRWRFCSPCDEPIFVMEFLVEGDGQTASVFLKWHEENGRMHKKRFEWIKPGTTASAGIPSPSRAEKSLWATINQLVLTDFVETIQDILASNVPLITAKSNITSGDMDKNRVVLPLDFVEYKQLRWADFLSKYSKEPATTGPQVRLLGMGEKETYSSPGGRDSPEGIVAQPGGYRRSWRDEFKELDVKVWEELFTMENMALFWLR